MSVRHEIIKHAEGEYISRTFSGPTNTEDIMDSFVYILNNDMISSECSGILTDLRDADLDFDMNSFQNLLIYIKSTPRLLGLKIGVIVDSADKIVFPMMASKDTSIKVQPFSTSQGAIRWITGEEIP